MFEIEQITEHGETRIIGKVDKHDVIIMGTHTNRPGTIMSCTCLPSDIEESRNILQCFNAVFAKYDEVTNTKYGWSLWDKTGKCYAEGVTTGDRCKAIARSKRKQMFTYDQTLEFIIRDPQGNDWMYSLPNTGWRIRWEWSHAVATQ